MDKGHFTGMQKPISASKISHMNIESGRKRQPQPTPRASAEAPRRRKDEMPLNEESAMLKIPLILFQDKTLKRLSAEAKILYSLMLDRMSMATRNGWKDEQGRLYVVYAFEEIMSDLHCTKERTAQLIKKLNDVGLIQSARSGAGEPIIYVMNFAAKMNGAKTPNPEEG